MGILKLKNSHIVAVLLGVSSGYCADKLFNENSGDDLFSPKPRMLHRGISIPTLVREDDGLGSDTAKYAQLLTKYMKLEERRILARQRWDENIANGIRTLQRSESAPREDIYETSATSPSTVGRYPELLKKYAEREAHARRAKQRWRQNILKGLRALNDQEPAAIVTPHKLRIDVEDTGVDNMSLVTPISFMGSPRPFVRADSPFSSSVSEAEDDVIYAPRHPSSSSLSYQTSTDRSDAGSYVSDSDEERKGRRGVFSSIWGWIRSIYSKYLC